MEESFRRKLKRGIKISVGISAGVSLIILLLTVERKTWVALGKIRPIGLFLLSAMWVIYTLLDGLRFKILTRAGDREISLRKAIEVILTGNFLAAVTPFQTGGFPVQLYLLNREGINPGKAMAFLAFRGILIYAPIYILAPIFGLTFFSFSDSFVMRFLVRYFFIILFIGILIIGLSLLKPAVTEKFLEKIRDRSHGNIRRLLDFLIVELEEFRIGLGLFLKNHNLKHLLLAALISIFSLLFYVGLVPALLYGLGLSPNVPKAMMAQVILMALLLFIPTPGAGGIAEAGGAALYSLICPKHILGVFIVLWRFFTFYLGAIIGGVTTLKEI